MNLFAIISCY